MIFTNIRNKKEKKTNKQYNIIHYFSLLIRNGLTMAIAVFVDVVLFVVGVVSSI